MPGCDAIVDAGMAGLDYRPRPPRSPRHLSVQGPATTEPALRHAFGRFGIACAVLPRVLPIQQVEHLCERDGRALLRINGIQAPGEELTDLAQEMPALRALGVDLLQDPAAGRRHGRGAAPFPARACHG